MIHLTFSEDKRQQYLNRRTAAEICDQADMAADFFHHVDSQPVVLKEIHPGGTYGSAGTLPVNFQLQVNPGQSDQMMLLKLR